MENKLTNEILNGKFESSFDLVNTLIDFARENMRTEFREGDLDAYSQAQRVIEALEETLEAPEESDEVEAAEDLEVEESE